MKCFIKNIFLISLLSVTMGCSGNQQSQEPAVSSSNQVTSSESKQENSTESSKESSIQSQQSSSQQSSSSATSQASYVENQLSLTNGLKIDFSATGAKISKITWDSKQIAKDGFTVGRCANRIAAGKCTINGIEYNLTKNNNGNHLHGGGRSWQGPFATSNWTKVSQTSSTITYSIHSADGAEGYPGIFVMTVSFTLSEQGELSIEYKATTDKDTLCNPTNHLFMSLNGDNRDANHKLWIDADSYTPLNSSQLPTGEIVSVEGTKFDYRTEKAFQNTQSYDDNYVLNGTGYRKVATLTGTTTGIKVDVLTDRPGLQLYRDGSGNICLESQMFPDAINQPNFEDPILKAGEEFYSKTTYHFYK